MREHLSVSLAIIHIYKKNGNKILYFYDYTTRSLLPAYLDKKNRDEYLKPVFAIFNAKRM